MKLTTVRKFAMSLPEVTEQPHFQYTSFRVKGKIFVTAPPEEEHVHVFVSERQRAQALATYSEFVEELLWGGKVVGLRCALAHAPPPAIKALIKQAWEHKAPKSVVARSQE